MSTFSYRAKNIKDFPFDSNVYLVQRDYSPPVENTVMPMPGMDGGYPVRTDVEPRLILVGFYAYGHPREIEREVASWLRADRDALKKPLPAAIIFDDEPELRYLGYPHLVETKEEAARISEVQVTFICPMPYAESITTRTTEISDVNNGTVPTPPIITATVTAAAGISDLRIDLDASNYSLLLDKACAQHEVIIFDKEKRLVTVEGVDAREDLHFNRRWFDIPTGSFSLTITPSSGVDVEITFNERYR